MGFVTLHESPATIEFQLSLFSLFTIFWLLVLLRLITKHLRLITEIMRWIIMQAIRLRALYFYSFRQLFYPLTDRFAY